MSYSDDQKSSSGTGKVVVSVGTPRQDFQQNRDAREIIQDARDEAFRIKKAAEEETRKVREESLEIEKRIAQREESLSAKIPQIDKLEKQAITAREAYSKKEQELIKTRNELIEKLPTISS